jgi:hypothetical protein
MDEEIEDAGERSSKENIQIEERGRWIEVVA